MDNSGASTSRGIVSPGKAEDSLGLLLDLDLTIGDERNVRDSQLVKGENINLVLELKNALDGTWPHAAKANDSFVEATETEPASDEMPVGDGIVGLYNMG